MSQKAFSKRNGDEPAEQQFRRWSRNAADRRRKSGRQAQERSRRLQLNLQMMSFNNKSSNLKLARGGVDSSNLEGWRNSAESTNGNTVRNNHGQSSAVREIPGFYYDPEKKRYFKITKDHPGKTFPSHQHGSWKESHERIIPSKIKVSKKQTGISVVRHLQQREYICGCSPWIMRGKMLEKLSRMFKVKQKLSLGSVGVHRFSVSRIEPDANHERLLTLYETQQSGNQTVQHHSLSHDKNSNLRIEHFMSMAKNQKITGLLWSPHKSTKNIFILSLLGDGNIAGETMLFDLNDACQRIVGRNSVQGNSVWTNAWSPNPQFSNIISIGASKSALTWDVHTKRRVIRVNTSSDVFAQEFSWSNPILFNGYRDGSIYTCDIRLTGPQCPVIRLRQGKLASITCIRVLHDENYVLSSGLDGSLKMWDLRARACVQNYQGHVNEITHGLPFYVDPTDSLIFAAGQDSVTRIWSVGSGQLLHSMPIPDGVAGSSLSPIPALYYSEAWGGQGGMPGLLYGAGDSIYSFSY